jgi:hypothetical protein
MMPSKWVGVITACHRSDDDTVALFSPSTVSRRDCWSIGAESAIGVTSCSDTGGIPVAFEYPRPGVAPIAMWTTLACEAGRVTSRSTPPGRRWFAVFAAGGALAVMMSAGCTSVLDRPSLPAAGTHDPRTAGPGVATTSASITPVTPDGLVTGPGVTDAGITLAVLADPSADRGFAEGVRLWQQSVNTTGGLCGRTVTIAAGGVDGVPQDPSAVYRQVGTTTLGLLAPVPPADVMLSASIAADQVPLVTATGTSAQLGPSGPLVAGATVDILAINGLQYLRTAGALVAGDTLGVLDDGSRSAANALTGARWWAGENDVALDVRNAAPQSPDWPGVAAVLAVADSTAVSWLVGTTEVPVLTLLDGFAGPAGAGGEAATTGRLFVATPAPAYGSDYPAAVAVASMAAATGAGTPGPRILDGYATGATWGRLITEACAERTLTRQGIRQAASTVGAAPATSLFGASDPGLVVGSGLPATRVSSISVTDPAAPTGLRSLAWLESAPDIEDYTP